MLVCGDGIERTDPNTQHGMARWIVTKVRVTDHRFTCNDPCTCTLGMDPLGMDPLGMDPLDMDRIVELTILS